MMGKLGPLHHPARDRIEAGEPKGTSLSPVAFRLSEGESFPVGP